MTSHLLPRISVRGKICLYRPYVSFRRKQIVKFYEYGFLSIFLQSLKLSSQGKIPQVWILPRFRAHFPFFLLKKKKISIFVLSFVSCDGSSVSLVRVLEVTENIRKNCKYFLWEEIGNDCWNCTCLCMPVWEPKAALSAREFEFKKEGR